ncbi:MAG TPA: FAD:protein FMN transferase [Candidatus Ozemobacteraceae bacterium]|nr:FAD:protein FMN transferase [Candidatus Ozemobacteraceae bacterium]
MNAALRALLACILAALLAAGCSTVLRVPPKIEPVRRVELMMDTIVSITAYGDRETASRAVEAAFGQMRAIEAAASFYRPDSELARLNAGRAVQPSAAFSRLLKLASEGYYRTNGAFDPSCAVLGRIWGFHDRQFRVPSEEEIREAQAHTGWDRCFVHASEAAALPRGAIALATGSLIDLGGIAGGMAIEAAAEALRGNGCRTFIIDDGGDLWMEGRKPDGRPWRVAVKAPDRPGSIATIEADQPVSVSTSGDYERFFEVDGRRFAHVFDVRSGRPAEAFRSVTVIASTPVDGDLLSTALFAMPAADARAFATREHIPALMFPASGPVWLTPAGERWFRIAQP